MRVDIESAMYLLSAALLLMAILMILVGHECQAIMCAVVSTSIKVDLLMSEIDRGRYGR